MAKKRKPKKPKVPPRPAGIFSGPTVPGRYRGLSVAAIQDALKVLRG